MDNQNSIERIDSAISDSRQATYDKILYSYYDEFRKGSVNFDTVYNKGQYYMAKQYGKRKEISSSVFMLLRAPKVYKMTSYNTPAGGSYNQLKTFWEKTATMFWNSQRIWTHPSALTRQTAGFIW